MLDNDAVECEAVEGLKVPHTHTVNQKHMLTLLFVHTLQDDLEYYIESSREPDFYADMELYEMLDIDWDGGGAGAADVVEEEEGRWRGDSVQLSLPWCSSSSRY